MSIRKWTGDGASLVSMNRAWRLLSCCLLPFLVGCARNSTGQPTSSEPNAHDVSQVSIASPTMEYSQPTGVATSYSTRAVAPLPTKRPTHVLTRAATATPNSVLTQPAATQRPAEPLPVVLTLEDAERQALAFTIPLNAAQVERSGHISRDALESALGSDRGIEFAVSRYGFPYESFEAHEITEPIIAVEVSRRGFNFPDDRCPIESSSASREIMTSYFMAQSGELLGHTDGHADLWSEDAAWHDPLQYETATPETTLDQDPEGGASSAFETSLHRTPEPAKAQDPYRPTLLAKGEYPAGVRDMIAILPLTVGSSWRYRTVGVWNRVEWSDDKVTVTVDAGWRWTEDIMEVSVRHDGRSPWGGWGEPRFVLPRGVLPRSVPDSISVGHSPSSGSGDATLDLDALTEAIRVLRSVERPWTVLEMDPIEIVRLPLEVGSASNSWFYVEERETVTVPAGTFEGCYRIRELLSTGWTAIHWLCPGIGFARHQVHGNQGLGSGCTVFELEAFDLPWRQPVP